MTGLFSALREQVEVNARHAVEVYAREITEYQVMPPAVNDQIGMYDFAVFIRRRTLELAASGLPLGDNDLASIAAVGQQRAEVGLSVPSQQQVLGLHTALMLHEIHDVSRPNDVNDLLRLVGWLGAQGVRARWAYLRGYTRGVGASRSLATRLEILARALLADEPVEPVVASGLDVRVGGRYTVSLVRIPAPQPATVQAEVVAALARHHTPVAWLAPDEVVVLAPPGGDALARVRDAVAAIGSPCQVGAADGAVGGLAECLAWAREASRVAPLEQSPRRLYAVADLFVEMSVSRTPPLDAWLRKFAQALASGPDLLMTLRAYYGNDMNRTATAATLHIHPRTLDYRLKRVRTVTGVDPVSTMGVRVLSAAVARTLADSRLEREPPTD